MSGPWRSRPKLVRPRLRARGRTEAPTPTAPLAARALAFVRALPDHRWLDRAVRGRTWIFLLGFLLAGIVAMQVEVLKLGASIGRSIEQGTALQSRNELLRATVAALSDDHRIELIAGRMGMVMPTPASIGFLSFHSADVQKAPSAIQPPNPTSFLAQLAADNAQAAASLSSGTSATTTTTGSGVTATGTTGVATGTTGATTGTTGATTGTTGATTGTTGATTGTTGATTGTTGATTGTTGATTSAAGAATLAGAATPAGPATPAGGASTGG